MTYYALNHFYMAIMTIYIFEIVTYEYVTKSMTENIFDFVKSFAS